MTSSSPPPPNSQGTMSGQSSTSASDSVSSPPPRVQYTVPDYSLRWNNDSQNSVQPPSAIDTPSPSQLKLKQRIFSAYVRPPVDSWFQRVPDTSRDSHTHLENTQHNDSPKVDGSHTPSDSAPTPANNAFALVSPRIDQDAVAASQAQSQCLALAPATLSYQQTKVPTATHELGLGLPLSPYQLWAGQAATQNVSPYAAPSQIQPQATPNYVPTSSRSAKVERPDGNFLYASPHFAPRPQRSAPQIHSTPSYMASSAPQHSTLPVYAPIYGAQQPLNSLRPLTTMNTEGPHRSPALQHETIQPPSPLSDNAPRIAQANATIFPALKTALSPSPSSGLPSSVSSNIAVGQNIQVKLWSERHKQWLEQDRLAREKEQKRQEWIKHQARTVREEEKVSWVNLIAFKEDCLIGGARSCTAMMKAPCWYCIRKQCERR
jgi:hypothetical protein